MRYCHSLFSFTIVPVNTGFLLSCPWADLLHCTWAHISASLLSLLSPLSLSLSSLSSRLSPRPLLPPPPQSPGSSHHGRPAPSRPHPPPPTAPPVAASVRVAEAVGEAAWMTVFDASSVERKIVATVKLGNGVELEGGSTYQPSTMDFDSSTPLSLEFPGMYDDEDLGRMIVLCVTGATPNVEKGKVIYVAGGMAMILMDSSGGQRRSLLEPVGECGGASCELRAVLGAGLERRRRGSRPRAVAWARS